MLFKKKNYPFFYYITFMAVKFNCVSVSDRTHYAITKLSRLTATPQEAQSS